VKKFDDNVLADRQTDILPQHSVHCAYITARNAANEGWKCTVTEKCASLYITLAMFYP